MIITSISSLLGSLPLGLSFAFAFTGGPAPDADAGPSETASEAPVESKDAPEGRDAPEGTDANEEAAPADDASVDSPHDELNPSAEGQGSDETGNEPAAPKIPPAGASSSSAPGAQKAPPRRVPANAQPLPPPQPDVPPQYVAKYPWRGEGWFAVRGSFGGPLDMGRQSPASSRVLAFGWGFEVGYRVQPWLGIGLGFARNPHDLVQRTVQSGGRTYLVEDTGHITTFDFALMRFFVPVRGRLEPWFDLAGGMSIVTPPLGGQGGGYGGQMRLASGLDVWVHPQIAVELALHYRANVLAEGVGHIMRGSTGIKFHW